MNQRFTLDRRSFEQFLAALSLVQQLKRQAAYQRALNDPDQPFFSLLQLQRAINSGTIDLPFVMASVVKLTQSVVGANAAGIWLFRNEDEFSCCAQVGNIQDSDRLGADLLAQLADSNNSDSCAFSPTLRNASHYPGSPNSVAIAALRVNGNTLGAVAAFSSDFEAFASRDLHNLHFLSGLLEQALQKAMQAGYREAIALEHTALIKLVERVGPQVNEFERQSAPSEQRDSEHIEDPSPADERALYRRLPQVIPSLYSSEPAEISGRGAAEGRASDISLPGVGVRAALGDVREFTGEERPSFLREAVRNGSTRLRGVAVQCRSEALRMVAATTLRMRIAAGYLAHMPHSLIQRVPTLSFARLRSISTRRQSPFARISQWTLKIRVVGLPRLHPSKWLRLNWPWFGSARSHARLLWAAFAVQLRTRLNNSKDRFSYFLRLSKVQARSLRRELRQARSNLSAAVAREKLRVRIAQRRQKSILANSADITGEALQHAGESLADVASSTGQSTITAVSTLKVGVASLRRPSLNPRALRRSAGAIGVLAIMAIFLALQASVRHSLEHVDAASAASAAQVPKMPAALAEAAVQPKAGPTSHLAITDASVADTLHDLTRYEIVTLQRAAEYGDDEAALELGMAYETGYYVRQNCSKAAHWVEVAAESGNPAAAYNLGLRYLHGDGVQVHESAAEHWLHMASARSYSPAKLAMAAVR